MYRSVYRKLDALKGSKFRTGFKINQDDRNYIAQKGLTTIRGHAQQFIHIRVASASPRNDGRQTPMRGHPVFVAQHATATCCRKCIQKWHGIEKGRALSQDESDYIVDVIMEWIERQVR